MKKGKFIAFEGIDASGKELQSKELAEVLAAHRYAFPAYHTRTGQMIQAHLRKAWQVAGAKEHKDGTITIVDPIGDALVFQALHFANRLEFASQIQLCREQGLNIVADRYTVSAEVYGASDGLDPEYLERLSLGLPQPDLTFLLDIPVKESFRRRPDRGGDRYEEDREKLEDVRQRYLDLFSWRRQDDPKKWVIINGTLPPKKVHELILGYVEELTE